MPETITLSVQIPAVDLPKETAAVLPIQNIRWLLTDAAGQQRSACNLIGSARTEQNEQTVLDVADSLALMGFKVRWRCTRGYANGSQGCEYQCGDALGERGGTVDDWLQTPTVLAVVPHWKCERWLHTCLQSLVDQSHPLTNIVVIDDGSKPPPISIVEAFPQVTLLASSLPQPIGPYRLVQSVVERVDYTAFLFQDADDWSSCDRLQTLLATARTHRADIVGSQEIRVMEPEQTLLAVGYPLDVNAAMRRAPGHGLLHPTSLITQAALQRVGGFATGLRFGADSEFLLRAHWVGRIVNSAEYCYFRRKRPGSLTTAAETGLGSAARQALIRQTKDQALERMRAVKAGLKPDLTPLSTLPLIPFEQLCGPELRWRSRR